MTREELLRLCIDACTAHDTSMALAFRRYLGVAQQPSGVVPTPRRAARKPKRRDVLDCMRQTHGVEGL